jgi:hypothetical protein
MNIDQQLASLLNALDDVIDLERGLADATLPRVHAELMAGLDNALNVEAGLAQVMPHAPRALDGFIAFAEELSGLSAVERLATRAQLPVSLLTEAYVLAKHVPTVCALASQLDAETIIVDFLDAALAGVRGVLHDLDRAGFRSGQVRSAARVLLASLMVTRRLPLARRQSALLRDDVAERLAALLREIDRGTRHIHSGLVDIAFADALLGPLSRLVSALTDVTGADLTSVDLNGLPLDGVRWSLTTRWPGDWQEWVRDNSVPVSADVFEIRSGKAGSWLPT